MDQVLAFLSQSRVKILPKNLLFPTSFCPYPLCSCSRSREMASERCDCMCSNCPCPTGDGAGGLLEYPSTGTHGSSAGQKKCPSENTPAAAVQHIFIKSKSQSLVDKSNYSISTTSQNEFPQMRRMLGLSNFKRT